MATVKRDDVKQQWEGNEEFPLVCETCLGDNPYIRMTKEAHGKRCGVCETPFTLFCWQAGTKGRLKRVEICRNCAQAKNVCQVCIFDLQYGLPVKVRDQVLREHGTEVAGAQVPKSMANRAWHTAQQQRALEQGKEDGTSTNALAHAKLRDMAHMEPNYERNLPRLCSFFARGECDRGSSCPFRHEMPKDKNDPLSNQNTKARFFGTFDPVATKMLEHREAKQREQDSFEKARATVYVRFPVENTVTEAHLRDSFYAFGEIVSVRCQPHQAFVEYTQPEAAELAIANKNGTEISGHKVFCAWARAPQEHSDIDADGSDQKRSSVAAASSTTTNKGKRPLPPPTTNTQRKIPKGLLASVVKPGVANAKE